MLRTGNRTFITLGNKFGKNIIFRNNVLNSNLLNTEETNIGNILRCIKTESKEIPFRSAQENELQGSSSPDAELNDDKLPNTKDKFWVSFVKTPESFESIDFRKMEKALFRVVVKILDACKAIANSEILKTAIDTSKDLTLQLLKRCQDLFQKYVLDDLRVRRPVDYFWGQVEEIRKEQELAKEEKLEKKSSENMEIKKETETIDHIQPPQTENKDKE